MLIFLTFHRERKRIFSNYLEAKSLSFQDYYLEVESFLNILDRIAIVGCVIIGSNICELFYSTLNLQSFILTPKRLHLGWFFHG